MHQVSELSQINVMQIANAIIEIVTPLGVDLSHNTQNNNLINSAKTGFQYTVDAIEQTEGWEKKEYIEVLKSYLSDLQELVIWAVEVYNTL